MGDPYMEITKVGRWSYVLAWHRDGDWKAIEVETVLGIGRAVRRARQLSRLYTTRQSHLLYREYIDA